MITPAPWTSGIIFNAKSARPNVIIWSPANPERTAIARDVAATDAALICVAPELLSFADSLAASHDVPNWVRTAANDLRKKARGGA